MASTRPITPEEGRKIRDFLCENGYCVVPNVLTPEFAQELADETARLNAELPHNPGQRYQGTHLDIQYRNNVMYDRLVKWEPARAALDVMGLGDFESGRTADPSSGGGLIVLTKEAKAPTLYWHQDWMAWNDPLCLTPWPQTIFLSYYMQGLSVENGCLQVIPGSHLRRTKLHDELTPLLGRGAHGAELVKDISHDDAKISADTGSPKQHAPPLFNEEHPEAVDVFAGPCDLVIADARLLHAARHNGTDSARDLLLLWHSRPGGQSNNEWSVPAWYQGPIPKALAVRPDDFEAEGTRVPGGMLHPDGPTAEGMARPDPRRIQSAAASSSSAKELFKVAKL